MTWVRGCWRPRVAASYQEPETHWACNTAQPQHLGSTEALKHPGKLQEQQNPPLLIRYVVASARGNSLPCCLQQHFPLPLLCVHIGSCKKCPFCRHSVPSPMTLDGPRNILLSYFFLLTGQLRENIDSAIRLGNPTNTKELGKPDLQLRIFHQLQRNHLPVPQSVHLSPGLYHCGHVLGRTG